MPLLHYFLVSEALSIDKATNRVTLFNVIDAVNLERIAPVPKGVLPPGVLTILPTVAATIVLRPQEDDFDKDWQAILKVSGQTDNDLEFSLNFKFPNGSKRHRLILRMQGIPITKAGELAFRLLLNGQPFASHVVEVSGEPKSLAVA